MCSMLGIKFTETSADHKRGASFMCNIHLNNQSPTLLGDSVPNIFLNSCGISLQYIILIAFSWRKILLLC